MRPPSMSYPGGFPLNSSDEERPSASEDDDYSEESPGAQCVDEDPYRNEQRLKTVEDLPHSLDYTNQGFV
eukprot:UN01591